MGRAVDAARLRIKQMELGLLALMATEQQQPLPLEMDRWNTSE